MNIKHRRCARPVSVLVLLAALTACGAEAVPSDSAPEAPVGPDPDAASYPGVVRLSATTIRTTTSGVAVEVEVPAGGPGCGVRPRIRVAATTKDRVRLNGTVRTSGAPECIVNEPATLMVDVELAGRDVVMNEELWEEGPGRTYVRCGGLGCDPPRNRCDPAYTHDVGADAEIPPERSLDVLACEVPWLVVDVRAVVTGCQSVDGSTPPSSCDVFSTRWFAHLEDGAWETVAAGSQAGCAEVLSQVPDFPQRLCATLPPL